MSTPLCAAAETGTVAIRGATPGRIDTVVHAEKLRNLIIVIAEHPKVTSLGLTKLWKLISFADVTALREHGATITGSDFVKYPHGPVPSRGRRSSRN
ncbi:MAG: hypothetical protein SGI72_04995 [Planctomycetota bacterium]|nr:hypothetical protein [Planctomycetota bacterium]